MAIEGGCYCGELRYKAEGDRAFSGAPGIMILKVGTLDDPGIFSPQMAIYTVDKQSFHHIDDGVVVFERTPG